MSQDTGPSLRTVWCLTNGPGLQARPWGMVEPAGMYSHYPEHFEREMGCTEDELRRWLPGALDGAVLSFGPGHVLARFDTSCARLQWQALPPRRIALLVMPRLAVTFSFDGFEDAMRQRVMRRFDLYTQRGGG